MSFQPQASAACSEWGCSQNNLQRLEEESWEGREQRCDSRKCCPHTHLGEHCWGCRGSLGCHCSSGFLWDLLRYPALAKQEDGRCGLLQRKPTHSILCFYPLSISDLHLVDLLPFAVNGFMSSFISQSKRFVFHMVLWDIQKQLPKTFSTTWLSNVDCSHKGQC